MSFPLVGSLLDSPERAEALAQVFRTLYSILDDNKVSYAQGTLQLVLSRLQLTGSQSKSAAVRGVSVTVRDQ